VKDAQSPTPAPGQKKVTPQRLTGDYLQEIRQSTSCKKLYESLREEREGRNSKKGIVGETPFWGEGRHRGEIFSRSKEGRKGKEDGSRCQAPVWERRRKLQVVAYRNLMDYRGRSGVGRLSSASISYPRNSQQAFGKNLSLRGEACVAH